MARLAVLVGEPLETFRTSEDVLRVHTRIAVGAHGPIDGVEHYLAIDTGEKFSNFVEAIQTVWEKIPL